MTIFMNGRKKRLFLSMTVGSLLNATITEASWPQARCMAQCNIVNLGKKAADKAMDKGVLSSKHQGKISNNYTKILNDCAENCDTTKITDVLFSGRESLSPDNLKKFNGDLKGAKEIKQEELKGVQGQLNKEGANKPNSKIQIFKQNQRIKDLKKNEEKLTNEISKLEIQINEVQKSPLENQISEVQKPLPKIKLEDDVLGKIAHPEDRKFIEPIIPGIDQFVEEGKATFVEDKTLNADNTLTKWGVVRILQALGIIVKRDPTTKTIDKDDVDKVITNDAKAIKSTGAFSEAIYVVVVNPKYLTKGHTKTHYVIKKNKWFSENMKIVKRDQNTPAKELIDLKKVQAYIVPKLSTARYAKIATIGNSLFYLDQKGAKQYFVVLEAADGRTVFDLFDAYAKDAHNQGKWDKIIFNVGRAVGELHRALSDQTGNKGAAQDFSNIKDFSDFKTIPHGDLHMQNIFYDESNDTVTFIDTGSMADTLKSKGSPVTDLVRFFTFTKYLQKIHYDFNKINRDLLHFADGYSKGFTGNEATQKKIEEFVLEYFKYFSTEYGKALKLVLNGVNPDMQPTLLPIIKFFFRLAPHGWPFLMNVFYDDFVSKEVKEHLLSHLVNTRQIQEPVGRAIVEKARPTSPFWPLEYVDIYADSYRSLSKPTAGSK